MVIQLQVLKLETMDASLTMLMSLAGLSALGLVYSKKKKYLIKQLLTEVLSLQDRVDLQKFPVINKLTVGINTVT